MIRKSWISCDRVIRFMLPLGKILFRSSTPGGRDRTLPRVSRDCSRDRQTDRRPCLSIGQQHHVGLGPSTCSQTLHLPLPTCTTTVSTQGHLLTSRPGLTEVPAARDTMGGRTSSPQERGAARRLRSWCQKFPCGPSPPCTVTSSWAWDAHLQSGDRMLRALRLRVRDWGNVLVAHLPCSASDPRHSTPSWDPGMRSAQMATMFRRDGQM